LLLSLALRSYVTSFIRRIIYHRQMIKIRGRSNRFCRSAPNDLFVAFERIRKQSYVSVHILNSARHVHGCQIIIGSLRRILNYRRVGSLVIFQYSLMSSFTSRNFHIGHSLLHAITTRRRRRRLRRWNWSHAHIKIFVYIWISLKIGQYRWVVLFSSKQPGNNVERDFVYSCVHAEICVSQCPFWRSYSVSKIRFFLLIFFSFNRSVCFLCSTQNVNRFGVTYIKHVRRATSPGHRGTAALCLHVPF